MTITQMSSITEEERDTLWDQGFRPWEIYVSNCSDEMYLGEIKKAGEISGWDIKNIFATREGIESYPFFDVRISMDTLDKCTEAWGITK